MGFKTRDEIVTEGLELAGDTSLTTRANTWLQAVLNRIYRKHEWPFLARQFPGVALNTGSTYVDVGAGAGGITDELARVNRTVLHDGIAGGYVADMQTISVDDADARDLPSVLKSANGVPTKIIVEAEGTTPNRWRLYPNYPPVSNYLLIVFANRLPPVLAANDKPIYPEDITLIQAVYAWALRQQQDERWQAEMQQHEMMVRADHVTHGKKPGQVRVGLSRRVFRKR